MMSSEVTEGRQSRVLFVDDDELLLDGLRDALWPFRRQWSMRFAGHAHQALEMLQQDQFDVVISDLRMPGMDGAELLERVRERYPQVVRIVLSGHADVAMVARAAAVAHRIIAKPCATDDLARVIERSCVLNAVKERVERDLSTVGASSLPAAPRLYAELVQVLSNSEAGAADVAEIVERDVAIAAKVLQLANSSYFGRRSPVSTLPEAVAYLGMEAIRAMVVQGAVMKQFAPSSPIPGFDLEALEQHSIRVARLAGRIAADMGVRKHTYTAGLLHDVGWLILAAEHPSRMTELCAAAAAQQRPLQEIERERCTVTHADIGAHLLDLWGLPPAITEAIAGHHDVSWLRGPFDEVAAVQVADALVGEVEESAIADRAPGIAFEDLHLLTGAFSPERLDSWRAAARQEFDGA